MDNSKEVPKKPWYKKWWAIALFVIVGLIILGNLGKDAKKPADISPQTGTETAQNASETATGKTYQQVLTFTGNGAKKSEPFTITGSRFKIKYDCKGDMCQAFLYKVGSSIPATLIMNTVGSVKDETITYGSGEYYIDANTMGTYTMIVEDYK